MEWCGLLTNWFVVRECLGRICHVLALSAVPRNPGDGHDDKYGRAPRRYHMRGGGGREGSSRTSTICLNSFLPRQLVQGQQRYLT